MTSFTSTDYVVRVCVARFELRFLEHLHQPVNGFSRQFVDACSGLSTTAFELNGNFMSAERRITWRPNTHQMTANWQRAQYGMRPSSPFHQNRYIKPRLFPHGSVARRCHRPSYAASSRLAKRKNPSVLFVTVLMKRTTSVSRC